MSNILSFLSSKPNTKCHTISAFATDGLDITMFLMCKNESQNLS